MNEKYLRICIQIPQIEFTRSVGGTKHCRMEGVPLDIVNVIVRLFERINWRDGRSVRSCLTRRLPTRRARQVC